MDSIDKERIKKIAFKIVRILGWIWLSVIALLIIISLVIQIPAVQNRLVHKAATFVQHKIGTRVSLDHISLHFPKKIVLDGIYLADEQQDTLLYAGTLAINTNLWALARKKIKLDKIDLKDFTGTMVRTRDGRYNFDYIIQAFSDTTAQQSTDTTGTPWTFSLQEVSLEKIKFSYQDTLANEYAHVTLGNLDVNMEEFDLEKSKIHVNAFDLVGVKASFSQTGTSATGDDNPNERDSIRQSAEASIPYDIQVRMITLKDIQLAYDSPQMEASADLGEVAITTDSIDLPGQQIALDNFSMANSFFAYHRLVADSLYSQDSTANSSEPEAPNGQSSTLFPWNIALNHLSLHDNSVQYYDFSQQQKLKGLDFNHLWLQKVIVEAKDIRLDSADSRFTLKDLQMVEHGGFGIRTAAGKVYMQNQQAGADDFLLETFHSVIRLNTRVSYQSQAELMEQFKLTDLMANLDEVKIARQDVDYLMPGVLDSLPVSLPADAAVVLSASLSGSSERLVVEALKINALEETACSVTGSITGLPDLARAQWQINPLAFYTTANDLRAVLPDTLLPNTLTLPKWLKLKGSFQGTLNTPTVKMACTTNLGEIDLSTALALGSSQQPSRYTATLNLKKFDLGTLLGQTTMGIIDVAAAVEGEGLTLEDLDTKLDVTVHQFEYNNYTYEDLKVHGTLKEYLFSGKATLQDPNLNFELAGDLNYDNNQHDKAYHFTFALKNADFKALHLAERALKTRFTLDADFDNADPENLNGTFAIRNVAVYNGQDLYKVDSLLFASIQDSVRTEVNINSDVMEGAFIGSFDLLSLPEIMAQYFHTYYALHDTVRTEGMDPQNFKFHLQLKGTALLTNIFVPELTQFVPGEMKGEFNSEEKTLTVSLNIHDIAYNTMEAHNLRFEIASDADKLSCSLGASNIVVASGVTIPTLSWEGTVANDSIQTKLTVYDSASEEKYKVAGVFKSIEKNYAFRFIRDEILLNYQDWSIPNNNYLEFGPSGMRANHMVLSHGNETIQLKAGAEKDSAISVIIQRLALESLTSIAKKDTVVSGTVDGKVSFFAARHQGAMEAALDIHKLTIKGEPVGDLHLGVDRMQADRYRAKLTIAGADTDIDVEGAYINAENKEPALQLKANIASLSLAAVQPLFMGQVKESSGIVTGNLQIAGTTKDPEIQGELTFKNAKLKPTYLNSELSLKNETIVLKDRSLRFDDFKVLDKNNNPIQLSGKIDIPRGEEAQLNLHVKARNFLLLNTTKEDNESFYGIVRINTDTRITQGALQPHVDMDVSLGEESNFTYVVPQSSTGVMDREGKVEFVDKDAAQDPFLASIQQDTKDQADTAVAAFKGIVLTANIELSDSETFNIVVDPITEDKLTVKGNTTLTLEIDPTGNMSLAGRYELSEGSYTFTFYKLVKREFAIEKGSTITWSGDPMNAAMDIKALYTVETSPEELLSSNTTDDSDDYSQRIPFYVYLNIGGYLLAPDISFTLDMPEAKRSIAEGQVYAILQDINTRESDLNKQVFALLILKRFVSDNPFENDGSETLNNTARRSVSRLLSEQLNRLTDNVKGIELNFDLSSYEDYSNGAAENKTQLELGISKSLFDERLVVKLSGNVNLEGESGSQDNASDYIGDLALEYKLTKDGRLRITGFRNSDYNMIDGELKETGIGFIYIKDYNTLSELFKANKKTSKKREN